MEKAKTDALDNAEKLICRPLGEKGDLEKLFILLTAMFKEVGRASLNWQKAAIEINHTMTAHAAFGVFHRDLLVGSVGLAPLDLFYTDAPFLIDKWFYIMPQYRPENLDSVCFRLLLAEVKMLCDATERPAFLRVFNDKRVIARNGIARISQDLCYTPAGATIVVSPGGEDERQQHTDPK